MSNGVIIKTGTVALQKALLNCLIGVQDVNSMPMFLGTYASTSTATDKYISKDIVFTARHIDGDNENGYKAVFTATILSNEITIDVDEIHMLASDKSTILAKLNWNEDDIDNFAIISNNISQNRQIVFTWEITIPLASITQESESE